MALSQTLGMLATNIIDHPDEEKYHRFKPTNTAIRKKIVDPKGTLEYAVEVRVVCFRSPHLRAHATPFVYLARIQARGDLTQSLTSLVGTRVLILEIGCRFPTILHLP